MPAGLKKHTVAKGGKKTTLCGLVMVWQLNGHTHTHTHSDRHTDVMGATTERQTAQIQRQDERYSNAKSNMSTGWCWEKIRTSCRSRSCSAAAHVTVSLWRLQAHKRPNKHRSWLSGKRTFECCCSFVWIVRPTAWCIRMQRFHRKNFLTEAAQE